MKLAELNGRWALPHATGGTPPRLARPLTPRSAALTLLPHPPHTHITRAPRCCRRRVYVCHLYPHNHCNCMYPVDVTLLLTPPPAAAPRGAAHHQQQQQRQPSPGLLATAALLASECMRRSSASPSPTINGEWAAPAALCLQRCLDIPHLAIPHTHADLTAGVDAAPAAAAAAAAGAGAPSDTAAAAAATTVGQQQQGATPSQQVSTPRVPAAPSKSSSLNSRPLAVAAVCSLVPVFNGFMPAAIRAAQLGGRYMMLRRDSRRRIATPQQLAAAGACLTCGCVCVCLQRRALPKR